MNDYLSYPNPSVPIAAPNYGGVPVSTGGKNGNHRTNHNTSGYITYDSYPVSPPNPPRSVYPPEVYNGGGGPSSSPAQRFSVNTASPSFQIPTYLPAAGGGGVAPPPRHPSGNPPPPRAIPVRENYDLYSPDDIKNAKTGSPSFAQAGSGSSTTTTTTAPPAIPATPAPPADINPMSIPCLAVYSHIKNCPICRQTIASMQNSQEFAKILIYLQWGIGLISLLVILVLAMGYWGYQKSKSLPLPLVGGSYPPHNMVRVAPPQAFAQPRHTGIHPGGYRPPATPQQPV